MSFIFEKIFFYFSENPIWQIIWIIALIVNIFTYLIIDEKKFFIFFSIICFLWWLHFHLLWELSWAFINYFEIFASLLVLKYKKSKKIFLFLSFNYILIWFLIYLFSWSFSYIWIIPIFNAILISYFSFFYSWIKLKLWICFTLFIRLIYWFYLGSIWWIISDIILFITWFIWAYKIYKNK